MHTQEKYIFYHTPHYFDNNHNILVTIFHKFIFLFHTTETENRIKTKKKHRSTITQNKSIKHTKYIKYIFSMYYHCSSLEETMLYHNPFNGRLHLADGYLYGINSIYIIKYITYCMYLAV